MPSTANGLPYPDNAATPDVPYWLQQLADAVEARIRKPFYAALYNTSGSDANGTRTIVHGAGFTPTSAVATSTGGHQVAVVAGSFTATTLQVTLLTAAGAAYTGNQPVFVHMSA